MRSSTSNDPSRSARVLMVDDNANGLIARKAVLEELGYEVVTTTTGQAAIQEFGRQRFDLIIADFKMPDMDGVELIRQVRATQDTIPIILLSGFVDAMGLHEKNTGADVVIQKSAHEVSQLVRAARSLLNHKAARKPARPARPPSQSARRRA